MARLMMANTNRQQISIPTCLFVAIGLLSFIIAWPNQAFALQLSPSSLSFSTIPGTTPSAQSLTFWKSGSLTKNWTATSTVPWLSASPSSGSITTEQDQVQVMVNPTGLTPGSYSTGLTITTAGTDGSIGKTVVPVTMIVATTNAALSTTPSMPATFTGTVGGPNPLPQTLAVSSSGSALNWTVADNAPWLSVTPSSGTTSGSLTFTISSAGLAAGTYTGLVTITAPVATNNPLYIPVTLTLTVSTASPVIGLSPTTLSFGGTVGGTNPAARTISVSNTGGGTLSWSASDNANWLTLSPMSGTNSGTVTASVNLSGLAAGTYNATVTASATGAATKTVPVTLTVSSGTTSPSIGFSPTSLAFSATAAGANPVAKTFNITNPAAGTLTWIISDNAAWLSVTPASGTTTTENDQLTATVNISGLGAGTYSGSITIVATAASNSPQTIPVTLTLSAGTAGTATLSWNASSESDLAGYKIYRATASGTYGAPIATLSMTTTSYVASGLQTGTTYFFVVTAYDTAGNESTLSNEVSKSIF